MTNFTQGKWEAEPLYGDHWGVWANNYPVLDCFGSQANARLVATAPEMYELLNRLAKCRYMDDMFDSVQDAKELLALIDRKEDNNG